jgi:hypothetical protein
MIKLDEANKLKLIDLIPENEHNRIDKIVIENNFILDKTEITIVYRDNSFREIEDIEGINLDHITIIKEIRSKFKKG